MLVGSPFAQAQQPPRGPNFVVVLADDLGYGDISPYGGWIQTPSLDRLAAQGLRFRDFHSNSPVCSPARAAFLTGRYPQRAGVLSSLMAVWRDAGMPAEEITVAEALKEAGYETALFGKWHLGSRTEFRPLQQGFDSFRGFLHGNVDYFSHLAERGFPDWWAQDERTDEPGYTTHLVTAHAHSASSRETWLLVLSHAAPHYPYQGPGGQAERGPGVSPAPRPRSSEERKQIYREMVVELDRGVGAVVSKLEELELQRDTLIFFFSDNGAPLEAQVFRASAAAPAADWAATATCAAARRRSGKGDTGFPPSPGGPAASSRAPPT